MFTDKNNRIILAVLLILCLLVSLECYVLPLHIQKGVVSNKTGEEDSKLRVAIFQVETDRELITVPPDVYKRIQINDSIEIGRSFFTSQIQRVSVSGKTGASVWQMGFVFLGGSDYLLLLCVCIPVYLFIVYNRINKKSLRRDLTIFLFVLVVIFLVLYCWFQ